MAQRIYIEPEDDIQSVIDSVLAEKDSAVEVVVPGGARILQNIVDAYLLRDAASAQKKSVTIVTNDVMGRIFAERAGISVASARDSGGEPIVAEAAARMTDIVRSRTPRAALRKTTKSNPGKKNAARESTALKFLKTYREERTGRQEFGDLKERRKKNGVKPFFKLTTPRIVGLVLVVALVVAGLVFGAVLPRADVLIYPVREAASFTVEVRVDNAVSAADAARGIIPGQSFTEEKAASGEFNTTSVKEVSEKARGTITIFNEYSSSPQIFIPSRFESQDGKIFWTTKNVTVPGAVIEGGQTTPGIVEAEVVAAEAGEAYNIGPSQFTMPALKGTERAEKIYARSTTAMNGGKTGEALVVSNQDLENAFETLETRLKPELDNFRKGLPEGFILWEEAYNEERTERSADKNAGQATEKFTATLKITIRAIAFKESDISAVLDSEIVSRMSQDKTILSKSKEITFLRPPVVDYQRGTIEAAINVKVDVIDNIDLTAFRGSILRKNKQEIRQILPSFEGVERVEVKLWPFWVSRVPKTPERVTVKIFGA